MCAVAFHIFLKKDLIDAGQAVMSRVFFCEIAQDGKRFALGGGVGRLIIGKDLLCHIRSGNLFIIYTENVFSVSNPIFHIIGILGEKILIDLRFNLFRFTAQNLMIDSIFSRRERDDNARLSAALISKGNIVHPRLEYVKQQLLTDERTDRNRRLCFSCGITPLLHMFRNTGQVGFTVNMKLFDHSLSSCSSTCVIVAETDGLLIVI